MWPGLGGQGAGHPGYRKYKRSGAFAERLDGDKALRSSPRSACRLGPRRGMRSLFGCATDDGDRLDPDRTAAGFPTSDQSVDHG